MPRVYIKYLIIGAFCALVSAVFVAVKVSFVQAEDIFLIEPADMSQTSTRDQRVNQRKAELKVQINEQSLKNLAARCEKVQKVVVTLKTRDEKVLIARHDFYIGSANKLNYIVENLKKRDISTASVETASQPFTTAVNKYLVDAGSYKTAIDDLAAMSCSKDTTGLRATILSAQQLRAQLASDVKNVKATFVQIKAAVEQAKKMLPKAGS
ncbi:hypothetical protein COU91_02445 [Candidatus Saccharibacteria bacterium CG10_big_fil_rev_8_21_14_0_10_47_8]|nr:MAG: hypothetical protein COU91_02445 [Candidatus Saccharibacteria bacterium CG10_big_fil_rev_8_21_14_0_10_47_8]